MKTALKKVWGMLAHPTTISIYAGILLAGFGATAQYLSSQMQSEKAHEMQVNDKRAMIAAELPVKLHRDLFLLVNRSFLRCDLNKGNKPGYLGRTRKETLELYNKFAEESINQPRASAFLAEVHAWFDCPDVRERAQNLENRIEDFERRESAISEDDIRSFDMETTEMVKNLISAMNEEVRAETTCGKL